MKNTPRQNLRLPDGRTLEYAEYGDPEGIPLLYFHGFLGSIHEVRSAEEAAKKHHIRLLAWNRSGVGGSTFFECRKMTDVASDVEHLLNHCAIEHCHFLGISGGAAYALECAKMLPDRTDIVWIVSALGPLTSPKIVGILHPFLRILLMMHRRIPGVGKSFFRFWRRAYSLFPNFLIDVLIRLGGGEREFLRKEKNVRHLFMDNLSAIFIEGEGEDFLLQELKMYSRWKLSSFPQKYPVEICQGKEDFIVPALMADEFLHSFPSAHLTLKPGGHFLLVKHLPEIMSIMRQRLISA